MFQPGGPTLVELVREALPSTCGGYDLVAAKFDCTPFRTPSEILDPVVGALTSAGCVLDVGCGTGASLTALEPITTERLPGRADLPRAADRPIDVLQAQSGTARSRAALGAGAGR